MAPVRAETDKNQVSTDLLGPPGVRRKFGESSARQKFGEVRRTENATYWGRGKFGESSAKFGEALLAEACSQEGWASRTPCRAPGGASRVEGLPRAPEGAWSGIGKLLIANSLKIVFFFEIYGCSLKIYDFLYFFFKIQK